MQFPRVRILKGRKQLGDRFFFEDGSHAQESILSIPLYVNSILQEREMHGACNSNGQRGTGSPYRWSVLAVLCVSLGLAAAVHRLCSPRPMWRLRWYYGNNIVVGSVNANRRHWYKAGEVLARSDRSSLARLVTRRERPEDFAQALERRPDDIKVVVQFAEA